MSVLHDAVTASTALVAYHTQAWEQGDPTDMLRIVRDGDTVVRQATDRQLAALARACWDKCECHGIALRNWIYYVTDNTNWMFEDSCQAKWWAPLFMRCIFGDPFHQIGWDSNWRTDTVVSLAAAIDETLDYDRMPILADALEDAGCTSLAVLEHCRGKPTVGCHKNFCLGTDGRHGRCPRCMSVWDPELQSRVIRGPHVPGCLVIDFCTGRN